MSGNARGGSRPVRRGLRARVAAGVIALGALLLVLQTVAVLVVVEHQEEDFIDQILLDEARRLSSQSPSDVPGGLIRHVVRTPEERAALPADLRELPPGLHELYGNGRELHVYVHQARDAMYYLLYDATRHEDRVIEFRVFLLLGIAITIAMLVWAGVWMSGRLVRQVSDLSRRVTRLDPAAPQLMLAPDYRDAEVVTLAQALDDYARRVAELVGREKEFTANVSHELRTPLTTIRTSCELLLQDAALGDKSRARVARVLEGADRMTELIETLLLLARDAPMGAREAVELRELVDEVIAPLAPGMAVKGIALRVEVPQAAVLPVHRVALALVLNNLLRNAVAYTDRGSVTVRYDGRMLSVIDTGTGIAADDVTHVFERSFRGRNARQGGAGIGLAIVKRLAERFGWRIGVASQEGEGTSFTIDLHNPAGDGAPRSA